MTVKEKATLVKQAGALYTLGLKVEKQQEKLRRLVSQIIPYDSPQMKKALDEFNVVGREWKRLEFEHLQFKSQMGKSKNKSFLPIEC